MDALVAAGAVVVVFAASGGIERIRFGSEGADITFAAVFINAIDQPIAAQVAELPFVPLDEAGKGGFADLERMVDREIPVLSFTTGTGFYVPQVIEDYFERLSAESFFRFVALKEDGGGLAFLCEAQPFISFLGSDAYAGRGGAGLERFVEDLETAGILGVADGLGFCTPAAIGIGPEATKSAVLRQMEKEGREWLPVLSADAQFLGVVERSRLTSSVLVDVLARLERDREPASPR
jgi:hypothetical protein